MVQLQQERKSDVGVILFEFYIFGLIKVLLWWMFQEKDFT